MSRISVLTALGMTAAIVFQVPGAVPASEGEFTVFQVHFRNELLSEFTTPLTGRFNILNATAVIGQAHLQGLNMQLVAEALKTFQGVKRRQEILGEFGGVLLIEDFAHHPTAVRETVKAIQNKYSKRRVFSVFEPRSATSRRKIFQKDYVDAFKQAQEILIAKAFDQGKISEGDRFSVEELIEDLQANKKSAKVFDSADQIVNDLGERTKSGDVVLIMSNGGFDGIYQKLINRLNSRGI